MRIPVAKIQSAPRVHAIRVTDAWVRETISLAIGGEVETVSGTLTIERTGADIRVSGEVSLSGTTLCAACGEAAAVHLKASPDFIYREMGEESSSNSDEEVELGEDELNVGWYTDDTLDLKEVLSEIVALDFPLRVLCEERSACDARSAELFKKVDAIQPANPFASLKEMCS